MREILYIPYIKKASIPAVRDWQSIVPDSVAVNVTFDAKE